MTTMPTVHVVIDPDPELATVVDVRYATLVLARRKTTTGFMPPDVVVWAWCGEWAPLHYQGQELKLDMDENTIEGADVRGGGGLIKFVGKAGTADVVIL